MKTNNCLKVLRSQWAWEINRYRLLGSNKRVYQGLETLPTVSPRLMTQTAGICSNGGRKRKVTGRRLAKRMWFSKRNSVSARSMWWDDVWVDPSSYMTTTTATSNNNNNNQGADGIRFHWRLVWHLCSKSHVKSNSLRVDTLTDMTEH